MMGIGDGGHEDESRKRESVLYNNKENSFSFLFLYYSVFAVSEHFQYFYDYWYGNIKIFCLERCNLSRISKPTIKQDIISRNTACYCSINQVHHCIRCFHLGQFPTFSCNRTLVEFFCRSNDVTLFRRCKQTAVDRKKRIAVAPTKCQKTESLPEFHFDMIKNFGTEFCFLTTGTVEKSIVDNEYIHTLLIRQFFTSSLMIWEASMEVNRNQFVLEEFRKR